MSAPFRATSASPIGHSQPRRTMNAGTTPAPTVRPRGACRSSDSRRSASGPLSLIDGAGARPSTRISSWLDELEERPPTAAATCFAG
jgi:hypothetical protein